ncbi:MFS transporter [Nocardioides sp. SYSU D00038]|uniref:MFS transporter n=1 Tax=Nocardioides sp. SYSU D00038 TaxID=2812554 RepID=UPI0019677D5D|nr:MFS transporter [Nocardioides sp. SYSU D00038]
MAPPAPPTPPLSLRSFWSDLPREGRLLLSVVVFEFIGTGLVLPFHVVYLHEVRDFPLSDVGLLLALSPLAGLLMVGPGGAAIDRFGARVVMISTALLLACGDVVLAFADTQLLAGIGLALNGAAFGMSFPAVQSLVATIIPAQMRQRYFGVNFALLNLGIGIGGVVGGFVVDVERLTTFRAIYLCDAASYAPALFLLLVPLRHVSGKAPRPPDDVDAAPVSYLTVLRQPVVGSLTLLTFVAAFVGYGQLNTGFPAFASEVSGVDTRGLGLAFAANTLVIVLLQLVVLRRIEGRRRTRVIVVMALAFAACWLLLGVSGLLSGTVGATLLVAACASVFALGETMMQPTIPALVNELAPDHLRGRYNALSSGVFNLAAVTAPVVAGFLIGHGHAPVYIGLLLLGCLACCAVSVLRLEPQLPPGANGVRVPPPEPADGAPVLPITTVAGSPPPVPD